MTTAEERAGRLFRSPHGALPNVLALGYTLIGYGAGVALLTVGPWWLNLIGVLLTGHALICKPIVPWHDLPALHAQLFAHDPAQVIPMAELLRGYHLDRLKRIVSDDYGAVGAGANRADTFLGAVGVSFLTAV